MTEQTDLLEEVVRELELREGQLTTIAKAAGLSYDTVLRIKRRENDPGYSKVAALHRYLFGAKPAKQGA
jgi:predicted transcriptional regulator